MRHFLRISKYATKNIFKPTAYQRKPNTQFFIKLSAGLGLYSALVTNETVKNNFDILENLKGGMRFFRSLGIGLTISFDYYFSMIGLSEEDPNFKAMMSRIHRRSATRIFEGCLLNGGTYVKMGQGLVCMSHILPAEYIEILKPLQDKCLTRKSDELLKLFKEDFGKEPCEIFKEFDTTPIAAASIAQVYKAKTFDGEEVAVKVQYINLQKRFESDVATINFLLKLAGILHPSFNFDWVLRDLEDTLKQELDFKNEARNSEICANDLKHLNYIYIPKVFWKYSSTRVLVTEFVYGIKISDIEALKQNKISLSDVDKKLFEAFGHQIFQSGFVHADPHPGNVLVRKTKNRVELVLLDHGLYQRITDQDRMALSELWKAIVLNDHKEMEKYSNKLGVKDYEMFAEILTQSPLKRYGFKLRTKLSEEELQEMSDFAKNQFDCIMNCLKSMPRSLLFVIRNLNTIRAITHDHGNPIDRYAVLARCATKPAFANNRPGFVNILAIYTVKIYFELVLQLKKISRWLTTLTLKTFMKINKSADIQQLFVHL